jgi:ribosome-associated translation inhibitor RaiA
MKVWSLGTTLWKSCSYQQLICAGNEQLFLPMLVRHLDHKVVAEKASTKANIVVIITNLARISKAKPTVAIIGAMSDLLKHLRKSIQFTVELSSFTWHLAEDHRNLQKALDECLTELVKRVHLLPLDCVCL